jgi:hypothetical protein
VAHEINQQNISSIIQHLRLSGFFILDVHLIAFYNYSFLFWKREGG